MTTAAHQVVLGKGAVTIRAGSSPEAAAEDSPGRKSGVGARND
jgi:hypothetical protein